VIIRAIATPSAFHYVVGEKKPNFKIPP